VTVAVGGTVGVTVAVRVAVGAGVLVSVGGKGVAVGWNALGRYAESAGRLLQPTAKVRARRDIERTNFICFN